MARKPAVIETEGGPAELNQRARCTNSPPLAQAVAPVARSSSEEQGTADCKTEFSNARAPVQDWCEALDVVFDECVTSVHGMSLSAVADAAAKEHLAATAADGESDVLLKLANSMVCISAVVAEECRWCRYCWMPHNNCICARVSDQVSCPPPTRTAPAYLAETRRHHGAIGPAAGAASVPRAWPPLPPACAPLGDCDSSSRVPAGKVIG